MSYDGPVRKSSRLWGQHLRMTCVDASKAQGFLVEVTGLQDLAENMYSV